MFTKVFKIILSHAVLVILVMFSKDICRFSLKNMSMSLIKVYRTHTTTNERLPTEQQNGYHGFATEQFIEGDYWTDQIGVWVCGYIDVHFTHMRPFEPSCMNFTIALYINLSRAILKQRPIVDLLVGIK